MKDRDIDDIVIDDILERAAREPVDAALVGKISAAIGASLKPVRPLAPAWKLALWLMLIWAGIAIGAAFYLGFYGIRKLDAAEIGLIFPMLGIFTWLAALVSVAGTTPGRLCWKNPLAMDRVMNHPALLLVVVCAGWLAIDAILFHNYAMGSFVRQGMPCLRAGVIIAAPTGVAGWMVLRRGFAVSPISAGLAAGTLAGLAGLTMLELHCPNLRAMHVMVWHTAVVPVSGLAGAGLAAIFRSIPPGTSPY